ncbi:MAG: SpoIIE family protein phosphatase [Bryobacteraceae bacterium]|nr:SpoIIE family protein phosphatase [Bryobacteraceae bacterium]MDW8378283.1 SpoIIE family protein phosphatase [Bryobacterales bacterium]
MAVPDMVAWKIFARVKPEAPARLDLWLAATVLVSLLAQWIGPSLVRSLGLLVAWVAGLALGLRLARRFVFRPLAHWIRQRLLWRLRNRLLVAYGFIALVPFVLIVLMAGLILYGILGQLSLYVMTVELERRIGQVIRFATWLAEHDTEQRVRSAPYAYPLLTDRLPGLELLVRTKQGRFVYPQDASLEEPPAGWGDAGGLVLKDDVLYVWAHIRREPSVVVALLPLTSRFLASLAPNLGEFTFMRFDEDFSQPARRVRLQRSVAAEAEGGPTPNRIPEKQGRLDILISWFTPYPVYVWELPGLVENEVLQVRTRPYAVLGTVFAQKVDFAKGAVPAMLLIVSIAFLVAEMVAMVIGVSLTRTITGAVHDLYVGTERVREGDFSHRVRVRGRDQLAALAESFNNMTTNIQRLLSIAKDNERLKAELEIAQEVQAQLYPRSAPEAKQVNLKAVCKPARMVSGDYYDFQRLGESLMAMAIGDVAGKGISAALLMATLQSAIRTQIRHCLEVSKDRPAEISTSKLVAQLNQHLYAHTTPEKYATFCFGVYDEQTGLFTYTNAGHLPPILLRNGEPEFLQVNGTVVGAFPFARYQESSVRMEPGDLLLFYTDGVTEPENAYGEQYGEERLLALLRRNHGLPPEDLVCSILEAVEQWTGSPELQDDITLLLAKRV